MQTNTFELNKDIFWVGVTDYDLRVFDITMETLYGTTYNAYFIKGSHKSALVDTSKANFNEDYLAKLNTLIDIKTIDYLILNHTEPDHSGSIEKILDMNPDIIIVASSPALSNIKEIVNRPFHSLRTKDDTVISLGNKTLRFFNLPNLHWPDTLFTYLEEDEILFTCDFFGAHYAFEGVLAKNVKDQTIYKEAFKYYFDSIMSPFKPFVLKALETIKRLKIKYIATSHGPVIDNSNLEEVQKLYKEWATPFTKREVPLVVIPYASAYGYTAKMAQMIKEGLEEAFFTKVDVELYDLVETPLKDIVKRIEEAEGLLIGSTTILNDSVKPVWDLLSSLNPVIHGLKFASAFGSYGWSGEAVKFIMERLTQLKMKTIEGIRIRFNPSSSQLQEAFDFGKKFGFFMQGISK
ncbi:MAG: FprA family A-type flavoprotein [Firmicutes bacterium]|nr:FprA family A-type flavoprotein [Bacillota bacterium]